MADQITSQRIVCKGGLNTSENFLLLSSDTPGQAVQLQNYETSTSGGYRRIEGFDGIDPDYTEVTSVTNPAEGPVLAAFIFTDILGNVRRVAARKLVGSAVYMFYELSPGVGWAAIAGQPTLNSNNVLRVRESMFVVETAPFVAFADGVNLGMIWDGFDWYQLDVAATGGFGGDQVVEAPALVGFFKGSLFFAGDADYPGVVTASASNNPFDFTVASGATQILPKFWVQQIKPYRDEMFIFGESAIAKAIPDLDAGFVLEEVTSNTGCIARDSVVEVGGNLLFLSADGIRPVAGTDRIADVELSLLSQQIQNTIVNVIENYDLVDLCAVVIRGKNQFRYFISGEDGIASESAGLLGSVRTYQGEHQWEFGELRGIHANCSWSGYVEGDEFVIHGDYEGNVFVQELGSSFNGEAITAVYKTPYLDFGDTTIRKTVRRVDLFLRTEGSVTLSLDVAYDWDRLTVQNPSTYDVAEEGEGSIYDSGAQYDDGIVYGGSSQPVFFINTQGSGYAAQMTVLSSGVIAPYTIQGMVVSITPKGRN